ncbi:MAG TPA: DUF1573 domain-containing protein [Pelobium sp.]|nr:DUF1573 domain-containing protein [Pelobium sp.]
MILGNFKCLSTNLCLLLIIITSSCKNRIKQPSISSGNEAKIAFSSKLLTLGTIKTDTAKVIFKVYNVGKLPLLISEIISDCQCTKPVWDKNRLLPGDSSSIYVLFVPRMKGAIMQKLTVYSNGSDVPQTLAFRAVVGDIPIN